MTKVFLFALAVVTPCAGLCLAFLLERFDKALPTVLEITRATTLPLLGVIPKMRLQNYVPPELPLTSAESFRSLGAALFPFANPPRIVQITSAKPRAGKTTIACNLACVLARNERRVLLIDADFQRPSVHSRFGISNEVGLASILEGTRVLAEVLQQIPEATHLDILTAGPTPPFPSVLIHSEAMRTLIEQCRGIYSCILVDSPPILSAGDGMTLAPQMDAVLLVIRHGDAARDVLRSHDLLRTSGALTAGLVLNASPTHDHINHS